jgi:mannose-1-phosphate guanylyltransferase / mannose-6-phosphate isomerase
MPRDHDAISLTPVVLCGGSGGRLWPFSRSHAPKQFMTLASERTLLQDTLLRVANPAHYKPPIIICGEDHRFLAAEQVRQLGISAGAIVLEPAGRGTAPAIALGALKSMQNGSASAMVIMPADHVIIDDQKFRSGIMAAADAAREGRIVTLGIKPDHPATGYGYITAGHQVDGVAGCFEIDKFIEKPALNVATQLVSEGRHYWNAGIFVGYPQVFIAELEARYPEIVEVCRKAVEQGTNDLDFYRLYTEGFESLKTISIDHAIMETTLIGAVVPVDIGWSDLGSWASLWQMADKDVASNGIRGSVHYLDTQGCYLRSDGPLLATIGIRDLIVVADADAVLVANRGEAERVKELVELMKSAKRSEVDVHRIIYRPWGSYESVVAGEGFQVKRLIVKPQAKLSLQRHRHRAEHWVVVRGEALVTRGTETFRLSTNQSTYIPIGEVHRLENDRAEPLHLIEVQTGSYLGEDDIVRLDDSYGRKGN